MAKNNGHQNFTLSLGILTLPPLSRNYSNKKKTVFFYCFPFVRCPFFFFYQCEMFFFSSSVNVSCPSQMANYTEDDGIGGWGLFGRD